MSSRHTICWELTEWMNTQASLQRAKELPVVRRRRERRRTFTVELNIPLAGWSLSTHKVSPMNSPSVFGFSRQTPFNSRFLSSRLFWFSDSCNFRCGDWDCGGDSRTCVTQAGMLWTSTLWCFSPFYRKEITLRCWDLRQVGKTRKPKRSVVVFASSYFIASLPYSRHLLNFAVLPLLRRRTLNMK